MNGPNTNSDTRWTIDRALLERLLGNEREFKEEVLVSLAELKIELRNLKTGFEDHVKKDDLRFGDVNMIMGGATGQLKYILGGAAAATVVIGLILAAARLFV